MLKYTKVKNKCYCGGPESCNLCRPDAKDKKKQKRSLRKQLKTKLKNDNLQNNE